MSELQAGMLALVIGGDEQENLGRTVCLIHTIKDDDLLPCGSYSMTNGWLCDGENLASSLYEDDVFVELTYDDWGLFEPRHLLPIPPISDPLDVTHKEELHA